MAGIRSEQEVQAARLAAEQAAREKRRKEIMEKVQILEDEVVKCQGLIASFDGLKGQAETIASQLRACTFLPLQPDMAAFNGITALSACQGLEAAQSSIGARGEEVANMGEAIETQIGQLNSYIIELRSRINTLNADL